MDKETRAIPTPYQGHDGMSLRDYYAAAALTGLCARDIELLPYRDRIEIAGVAFGMADAMLERREKNEQ
jgi:hypothetical protein